MGWDETFDVVCVGSGVGGLTAAATAGQSGLRVLLIEKDAVAGGVTARSGGQLWVGASHLENELGIPDTEAEVARYLKGLADGLAVEQLAEVYVNRAPEVVRYLTDTLGVQFEVIRDLPDYYYPRLPGSKAEGRYLEVIPFDASRLGPWAQHTVVSPYDDLFTYVTFGEILDARAGRGQALDTLLKGRVAADERCAGAGLSAALLLACLQRHVDVRTSCRAVDLVVENGTVEGIVIEQGGQQARVSCRAGVVLATGGYDWDAARMLAHEGLAQSGSMAPATVEGDHLAMAERIGVEPYVARSPEQTPIFIGYHLSDRQVDGRPMYRCLSPGQPHSFIVNNAGRRFADDSFYPDVVGKVTGTDDLGAPNWPAWWIFDQDFVDMYGVAPIKAGQPIPTDLAVQATTLRELASGAGVDADGLEATAARFNAACVTGIDDERGRGSRPWSQTMLGNRRFSPNPNLAPVARAPFYAVELERVAMGVPSVGLPTDEHGRVLTGAGDPVDGLYAAGNAAAWRDIGGGYNSGIANTRGALFGFLSALHLATRRGAKVGIRHE